MGPDSIFGELMRVCVSDRYLPKDRAAALEGLGFVVLGLCSSFVTTYVLSNLGYLV